MRKALAEAMDDELRPEYDLSQLKGRVRGKNYQQAKAGTNLVLIDRDLVQAFPDDESVNRALRLLLTAANAAKTGSRRRGTQLHRRFKRASGKRGRPASRR